MSLTNWATIEVVQATVVHNESEADECTLHPARPPEEMRATMWITAKEGSYVQLTSCR